ncbi:hypothetical protein GGD81_003311 [Rhodobium orientis]|uniref:Uncharacterized protein n=1 Tax=Rhodobium orientis TaxID=34017 RepID=A0A327JTI9_9HYPH|nr:hypothetical protein [Rhodobium orientis]MBB4304253.1 hypothetical protein [Rhodobium orientis]MBK5948251.1 hypothetical protein [Rhodobium orientis]RAI28763.1 hypothetical protein CH339_04990 [Rhodobium orientis]
MTEDDLELAGRIVSLGDNCEFGFVQRHLGLEPSGLLRWAIAWPENVIALLERIAAGDPLEGFFAFPGIEPYNAGMVREPVTGLLFHSQMRSSKDPETGVFSFQLPDDARREIHSTEESKFSYLLQKFQSTLRDEARLYVIRGTKKLTDAEISRVDMLLRGFNPGNRLLVQTADPERPGTFETRDDGILIGYVRQLATYVQADCYDREGWADLIKALRAELKAY